MPQYRPLGTAAAPATWTLPASLELAVSSVYASYNGSGAAGSYIPTLEVISDAGDKVVSIPQDASVAAGSSVEASWAPFLKGAAAASATKTHVYYATGSDSGGSVASGGTKTVVLSAFTTNDQSNVALDFSGGITDQIVCVSASYNYVVTATVEWSAFAGNRTITLGTANAETGWGLPFSLTTADSVQVLTAALVLDFTAPTNILVTLSQSSGSSQTWTVASIVVHATEQIQ